LTTANNINEFIRFHAEKLDKELTSIFPVDWKMPEKLKESLYYSLTAGGKRMRPVLLMAAVESLGGSVKQALPVACAVEMIHTYSLIHDDLPAMDNDDFRRGKLTNHKVYGEAMAVLAGDALLTHAFYVVSQARFSSQLSAEQILSIVDEMSQFAGPIGMVGGQAADIEGEQGITDIQQLEYIHIHKTSDLIVFSLRAGGYVAGANATQLEALKQFGRHIGLAFQIQDDILDIIGDEVKLGKPLNSDEKAQKVTYPYFLGLEACKEKVKELTNLGKTAILDAGFPHPERLLQLADFLVERDR
jgi:geranylgeranyl diphosphate synthase type II